MIRRLREKDVDKVMELWLNTNIKAHSFIMEKYWLDHMDIVRDMLPQSEVYVYENETDNNIQGFVGINDDYIAGIFVWSKAQSNGIGTRLLDFVKSVRKRLALHVYCKNERAVRFYLREHFKIQYEKIDENTGEREYFMVWEQ